MAFYVVGGSARGIVHHHQYETATEALAMLKEVQQNDIPDAHAYDDHGDQLSMSRLTFLANVDAHLDSLIAVSELEQQRFPQGTSAAWQGSP